MSQAKETLLGNTIVHICDFRRGVLNTRSVARIQHLLPGHKYGLWYSLRAVFGWRGKFQNLFFERFSGSFAYQCHQSPCSGSKQKSPLKSSNPLKGLNNLFISYEKQNTKEAYNSKSGVFAITKTVFLI